MVKRDSAWLRTQRLDQITKRIAKNIAQGVDLQRLLLWIQTSIGLTRNKAIEYIDLILEKQEWIIEEGVIKVGTD